MKSTTEDWLKEMRILKELRMLMMGTEMPDAAAAAAVVR